MKINFIISNYSLLLSQSALQRQIPIYRNQNIDIKIRAENVLLQTFKLVVYDWQVEIISKVVSMSENNIYRPLFVVRATGDSKSVLNNGIHIYLGGVGILLEPLLSLGENQKTKTRANSKKDNNYLHVFHLDDYKQKINDLIYVQ